MEGCEIPHRILNTTACTAATTRLFPLGGIDITIPGVNTKKRRVQKNNHVYTPINLPHFVYFPSNKSNLPFPPK